MTEQSERVRRVAPDERANAPGGVDLSVIVPFYNEEDNVGPLYARLTESAAALGLSYELLFVNDGSGDATEQRLRDLAATDRRVVVINLVRNQCSRTKNGQITKGQQAHRPQDADDIETQPAHSLSSGGSHWVGGFPCASGVRIRSSLKGNHL